MYKDMGHLEESIPVFRKVLQYRQLFPQMDELADLGRIRNMVLLWLNCGRTIVFDLV